jgi:cobalt-zinc-cadmium efflux system protein
MVTDSASLALAAFAAWLSQRPPTQRHTYGYGRVETLAALLNVLFMVLVVVGISVAAVDRILDPAVVKGGAVTVVAALGLLLNIAVAWLLMHGEQTMNTRGALLHVLGDLLGSVAALVSGAIVMATGWMTADPLLSLLICALMLASSLRLLREVLQALMEGVPPACRRRRSGACSPACRGWPRCTTCTSGPCHRGVSRCRRISSSNRSSNGRRSSPPVGMPSPSRASRT